jgi:hypothetical protein
MMNSINLSERPEPVNADKVTNCCELAEPDQPVVPMPTEEKTLKIRLVTSVSSRSVDRAQVQQDGARIIARLSAGAEFPEGLAVNLSPVRLR